MVADTQQSSARAAHFNSAVYMYRQQGIIQQRARGNNIHRFLQAFADNTQHKQAGTGI